MSRVRPWTCPQGGTLRGAGGVISLVHRLALASASAALAAGVAVAAHASVSTHALLGLVWSERTNDAKLVQVDPQSLRPTGKRAIVLRGASGLWSFSPDRRRLVLATYRDAEGGNPRASLRFVDARRLRVVRTVRAYRA
jgi:hypothetical protein